MADIMSEQEKETREFSSEAEQNNDVNSKTYSYPQNPRELIENPAVTPEMLETAPEDLRGDLFKDESNE